MLKMHLQQKTCRNWQKFVVSITGLSKLLKERNRNGALTAQNRQEQKHLNSTITKKCRT